MEYLFIKKSAGGLGGPRSRDLCDANAAIYQSDLLAQKIKIKKSIFLRNIL